VNANMLPWFRFKIRGAPWRVYLATPTEVPELSGFCGITWGAPLNRVLMSAANTRAVMEVTLLHELAHAAMSDYHALERDKEERIALRMEHTLPALRRGGWKLPPYPPGWRAMRRRALEQGARET
jgi:hypothetical protein